MAKASRNDRRLMRHKRVRKDVSGTPDKPRLSVYRSNNNISAQIIDDVNGNTIVSASTLDKEIKGDFTKTGNKEAAKKLGKRAIAKGIEEVAFDRGGYIYHGRVKELAEGAREAGLKF